MTKSQEKLLEMQRLKHEVVGLQKRVDAMQTAVEVAREKRAPRSSSVPPEPPEKKQ
jgi:hypothetical protein